MRVFVTSKGQAAVVPIAEPIPPPRKCAHKGTSARLCMTWREATLSNTHKEGHGRSRQGWRTPKLRRLLFPAAPRNATASQIACWCTRSKNNSGTNSLEVVAGLSAGSCSTWGTWWTPPSKLGLFCANRRIARTRQPPSMPRAPLMLGFHRLHPTSCARTGQATQRCHHRTQQQLLPKRSLHSTATLSAAT